MKSAGPARLSRRRKRAGSARSRAVRATGSGRAGRSSPATPRQPVRSPCRLAREHQDVGAGVSIDREAEVDLPFDIEGGLAVHERDLEALDVHADDLLGGCTRLVWSLG